MSLCYSGDCRAADLPRPNLRRHSVLVFWQAVFFVTDDAVRRPQGCLHPSTGAYLFLWRIRTWVWMCFMNETDGLRGRFRSLPSYLCSGVSVQLPAFATWTRAFATWTRVHHAEESTVVAHVVHLPRDNFRLEIKQPTQ